MIRHHAPRTQRRASSKPRIRGLRTTRHPSKRRDAEPLGRVELVVARGLAAQGRGIGGRVPGVGVLVDFLIPIPRTRRGGGAAGVGAEARAGVRGVGLPVDSAVEVHTRSYAQDAEQGEDDSQQDGDEDDDDEGPVDLVFVELFEVPVVDPFF